MKNIPYHIVLFPDGNRRWARKKGLSTLEGHLAGHHNFKKFCLYCQKKGVKIITVFGFSTENWKRPKEEVDYLMNLFKTYLIEDLKDFQKNRVRVKIIGQKEKLPKSLQKVIKKVEAATKNNKKLHLNLAVSYGGRWDIIQAVQQIVRKKIPARKITENLISKHLSITGLPAPDLVIRAGGEQRLSNFVLWQAAYSELYFSKKLWPDFNEKELNKIFKEYARRQRRFGR